MGQRTPAPGDRSTTASGAPAPSDQLSLTVGPDGPLVLHDVHFVEQMAHFNREKVPERQPHAKGSGAFGFFEVTEDVSQFTRAAVFQPGARTDVLVRFSIAGEMGSPDVSDVRGFAVRFYTSRTSTSSATTRRSSSLSPVSSALHRSKQQPTPTCGTTMQWDFWTLARSPPAGHLPHGRPRAARTWRHERLQVAHLHVGQRRRRAVLGDATSTGSAGRP